MSLPDVGLLAESRTMDGIHNVALMVALIIGDLNVGIALAQVLKVVLERLSSIDSRFPTPQKIEVWAIDD